MRKSWWRPPIALFVCLFLIMATPTSSRADVLSSLKQDLDSLTGQYQQMQQQRDQVQNKVNYLQSQADALQSQLDQLSRRMRETAGSIRQGQARLASLNSSIAALGAQIASNEAKQAHDQHKFNQILVGVYEDGPVSYLQVLLGASSFSDFLSRLNYMGAILAFDRNVLVQLISDHQNLAVENQALAQARQAQLDLLAALGQLQQQQKSQAEQKSTLLNQVQAAKQREQAELNSENAAMRLLSSRLKALQEKYRSLTGTVKSNATWLWPLPGHYTITSGYGWRYIFGHREFHNGIDIGAPYGTPIVAANSGVVLYAGPAEGFGHWIVIQHSDGLMSVYGHMYASGIYVRPGQVVQAGETIGAVGADGEATGPHLHFSIITGFDSQGYMISVDPLQYVSP